MNGPYPIGFTAAQSAYDNDDGIRDVTECVCPFFRNTCARFCPHSGSCAVQRADAADNAADAAYDAGRDV